MSSSSADIFSKSRRNLGSTSAVLRFPDVMTDLWSAWGRGFQLAKASLAHQWHTTFRSAPKPVPEMIQSKTSLRFAPDATRSCIQKELM